MGLGDSQGRHGWRDRAADAGQWIAGRLRLLFFRIKEENVSYESRGVEVADPVACERFEKSSLHFARGFNAAMTDTRAGAIGARIGGFDSDVRGFAFEGAGMALSVLDALLPPRRRIATLLDGPGERYSTLIYIGIGWSHARMRRIPKRPPPQLDPVLGWVAFDGAGFHEGMFKSSQTVDERERPAGMSGPALRLFDQGVGRSLLFTRAADLEGVRDAIAAHPADRHADLWSGVGVAATYPGALSEDQLRTLCELAHPHELRLAQGAAFAVMARVRAGDMTAGSELAASMFCGLPASEVAARAEAALADLPLHAECPYEMWQARLRESFATEVAPL